MAIPAAIILGFALIAAAIYFGGGNAGGPTVTTPADNGADSDTSAINPITADDHIRGNPNARVLVVEYSDFDCPFCKQFHDTMNAIMDEFGASGQVAWVYRHFPLQRLHPSAPFIAEASECVAELGGDEAFWTFSDLVFGERGPNEPTNLARLTEFAVTAGVNEADYQACLESERNRPNVEEDFNNGVAIGVRGTPYSVILIGEEQLVLNGAQPYEVVRPLIARLVGADTN